MFLVKPSETGGLGMAKRKRVSKTLVALYRLLEEDFNQRRPAECSCRMPMVFEVEGNSPDEPNWRVEALWCGSIDCQDALAESVSRYAALYDLAIRDESLPASNATAGF